MGAESLVDRMLAAGMIDSHAYVQVNWQSKIGIMLAIAQGALAEAPICIDDKFRYKALLEIRARSCKLSQEVEGGLGLYCDWLLAVDYRYMTRKSPTRGFRYFKTVKNPAKDKNL